MTDDVTYNPDLSFEIPVAQGGWGEMNFFLDEIEEAELAGSFRLLASLSQGGQRYIKDMGTAATWADLRPLWQETQPDLQQDIYADARLQWVAVEFGESASVLLYKLANGGSV